MSALEALETINRRLKEAGITLHLSEVKGPVMDRLRRSEFLDELTGKIFLSHYDAILSLDLDAARSVETGGVRSTA
jgi:SulP family sulfate permease